MRIITGTLKGRRLNAPATGEVRPTSERTKEGMFNVIDARRYFDNLAVLDLFAGSGNLGFEAISRGVERVVFVDSNRASVKVIEETAERFGVSNQVFTICTSVDRYLNGPPQKFDLIFADPPYDLEGMSEMVVQILEGGWLEEDGWFLLEHDKRHNFSEHPNCVFSKPYGRTIVSIFKMAPSEPES